MSINYVENNCAFMTNGMSFIVSEFKKEHLDMRLKPRHCCARLNIYDPITKSRNTCPTMYENKLRCLNCNKYKLKRKFKNYSIIEKNRHKLGLNISCRDCNPRKYSQGYLKDGFVV